MLMQVDAQGSLVIPLHIMRVQDVSGLHAPGLSDI